MPSKGRDRGSRVLLGSEEIGGPPSRTPRVLYILRVYRCQIL
jgi:hypothetical protein